MSILGCGGINLGGEFKGEGVFLRCLVIFLFTSRNLTHSSQTKFGDRVSLGSYTRCHQESLLADETSLRNTYRGEIDDALRRTLEQGFSRKNGQVCEFKLIEEGDKNRTLLCRVRIVRIVVAYYKYEGRDFLQANTDKSFFVFFSYRTTEYSTYNCM